MHFAGYIISQNGCKIDPKKVAAIRNFEIPKTVTDVKSFQGVCQQFKDTCPNLMGELAPLTALTSTKTSPSDDPEPKISNSKRAITWTPILDAAFKKVKKLLTDASGNVLAHYNPNKTLYIYTDASRDAGLGHYHVEYLSGRSPTAALPLKQNRSQRCE